MPDPQAASFAMRSRTILGQGMLRTDIRDGDLVLSVKFFEDGTWRDLDVERTRVTVEDDELWLLIPMIQKGS